LGAFSNAKLKKGNNFFQKMLNLYKIFTQENKKVNIDNIIDKKKTDHRLKS